MPVLVSTGSACPPGYGWVQPEDIADCATDLVRPVDLDQACNAAAELLFALSGGAFGTVVEIVRPVRLSGGCQCGGAIVDSWSPTYLGAAGWWAWPPWSCGCSRVSAVDLLSPVTEVTEVKVDGVTLDPVTDYKLYESRWLVRLGGHSWPCCSRLDRAPTEPGSFVITYEHGPGVPAGGKLSAQVVACEVAHALAGMPCLFTGRISNVTRDGVSAAVVDPGPFLSEGRTGLTFPDLWLASLGDVSARNRTAGIGFPGPQGLVRDGS